MEVRIMSKNQVEQLDKYVEPKAIPSVSSAEEKNLTWR